MLRGRLFGTLTLFGALLALPGTACAQGGSASTAQPAPTRVDAGGGSFASESGFDGERAVVARKVIATSQPAPPSSMALVPVPDDGLTLGLTATRSASRTEISPSAALRPAIYRTDVDPRSIEAVSGSNGPPVTAGGSRTIRGPQLNLFVEGPTEIVAGKPFVYLIHVQSTGTAPATAVRVTDRLPQGVHLIGAEPKPEIAGDRLTWELGDLPPGMERRVRIAIDAERLTREFLVSPTASFAALPGLRATPARPGLEVRLTGPEAAPPGVVPYRVQLANNGATSLGHVVVLVKLTAGLRHPSMGNGDAIEADIALASGETKTLPLDLVAGAVGPNAVTASVRADGGLAAEARAAVFVDATAPVSGAVVPATPRVRVEINNLSENVTVGAAAVYEIRLTNADETPLTGIRLLAQLSEGLEPDQADGPTAAAVSPRGVVFETLRRLGPGEAAVYHVRSRTKRAGVQQLRAEVNADRLAQPATGEASTWVAPGRGR